MKKTLLFISALLLSSVLFTSSVCAESESEYDEAIIEMLQLSFEAAEYCKIEKIETGFIVRFAMDGVYASVQLAKIGLEDLADWKPMIVQKFCELSKLTYDFLISYEIENANIVLVLMDDLEYKTPFLIVLNGDVIYDVLAD